MSISFKDSTIRNRIRGVELILNEKSQIYVHHKDQFHQISDLKTIDLRKPQRIRISVDFQVGIEIDKLWHISFSQVYKKSGPKVPRVYCMFLS